MASTLTTRIVLRNDTTANWAAANPVLLKGEIGVEFTEDGAAKLKLGDGVATWSELEYFGGETDESVIPVGDGKSIVVEDGTISLLGFGAAEAGQVPRKNADGDIEWHTPVTAETIAEINEQLADVYTKAETTTLLAAKVTEQITTSTGTALIQNEETGGGAKYWHTDGSEAFVGVNNGGQDGMMAQIYADIYEDSKYVGSRINVYLDGIYYTSLADKRAGIANNDPTREIATRQTIADALADIYTKDEIDSKLSSVYRYMGSVESYSELPTEDVEVGHVYNIVEADEENGISAGDNVAWNGEAWDNLHGIATFEDAITEIQINYTPLDIVSGAVNIPMATADALGVVKSSEDDNKIRVNEDGTMEIVSISLDKLVESDDTTLVLNGGGAEA